MTEEGWNIFGQWMAVVILIIFFCLGLFVKPIDTNGFCDSDCQMDSVEYQYRYH